MTDKIISNTRIATKKLGDQLPKIKERIKDWSEYFKDNFVRFNNSRKFVFETSLSEDDRAVLSELGMPQLEFNILEAYLSRLRGEFSTQEPGISISSKPAAQGNELQPDLIEFLEGYTQQILFDSNKDNLQYDVFTDILSGGFSAIKVINEYDSSMSFDYQQRLERFFDPTLSVFDKSARLSHKGDGRYSAELFPKTMEEIEEEYGSDIAKKIKNGGSSSLGDFRWNYTTSTGEEMALIADYYEKKIKKERIVKVAPFEGLGGEKIAGQVMTVKRYEQFAQEWSENRIEQVPAVIGKPRRTEIETIDRYLICGDCVIEHNATDWRHLPHIFVDGNSLMMRKGTGASGASYQLTRPFLYHAQGIQRLKNYAGISLANEIENTVQHKFMMAVESIPSQYTDPLTDIQKASVVLYNAYSEDHPDKPLPPPTAAPRAPIPPEITATFTMSDQMTQTILGSYDAALGINNNQLSGTAIKAGATQSNPVAVPYIVGYMKAMTQAATIILDLIPKYMQTPRSMPITDKKGKKKFIQINQEGGVNLQYDSDSLDINIKAGSSFEIQRAEAFGTMMQLMQISPEFNEFATQGDGMMTLLDNIDIRGIEKLKAQVTAFAQMKQQQKQEAMQQQQEQMKVEQEQQYKLQEAQIRMMIENNPAEIKMAELKIKAETDAAELQLKAEKDAAEIEIKQDKVSIDYMKAASDIENQEIANELQAAEIDARNARTAMELETKKCADNHKRAMDILTLHNKGNVDVNIGVGNKE